MVIISVAQREGVRDMKIMFKAASVPLMPLSRKKIKEGKTGVLAESEEEVTTQTCPNTM